jgi:mannosyltransferase
MRGTLVIPGAAIELRPQATGVVPKPVTTLPARRQHAVALGMGMAASALLIWNLDRPALWMDESASLVATQRTWPHLWTLMHGAEAPLVPYYALLKATTFALIGVVPSEILYRWPSVAVSVVTVWAMTLWLVRRGTVLVAVCAGAVLLMITGFSRYGQEARPYAFALAAAVASTMLWTRLVGDPRRRWILLYALSVSLLAFAHAFAIALVGAHLVAAIAATSRASRRAALLRTGAGAGLALVAIAPFILVAAQNGRGTSSDQPLTPRHMARVFAHVFNESYSMPGLIVVSLLAAVGATRAFSPTYRDITRLATAWALVPLVATVPVIVLGPNLMMDRYVLFVVPAWAILSGLGIVTLAELVGRAWGRRAAVVAVVLLVGVVGVTQLDALRLVRSPAGHGEDVRPALLALRRDGRRQLPIVVSARTSPLEFLAYDADAANRVVGVHVQRHLPSIWPSEDKLRDQKRYLRGHPRVVLLIRADLKGQCRWQAPGSPGEYVRRCMPKVLRDMGYQVVSAEKGGPRWVSALLTRETR